MNKQQFIKLLEDQKSIKKTDLTKVNDLVRDHPYSQVLHVLSAVASHQLKSDNQQKLLTRAAIYAADRSILKEIITQSSSQAEVKKKVTGREPEPKGATEGARMRKSKTLTESKSTRVRTTPKSIAHAPSGHPGPLSEKDAEKLRKEVIKNLEKLLEIKAKFLNDHPENKLTTRKKKLRIDLEKEYLIPSEIQRTIPEKKTVNKPVADRKPTLTVHRTHKVTKQDPLSTPKLAKTSLSQDPGKRKKEQLEIIDKFVKADPKIKNKKKKEASKDQADLSQPSVEFNENLVSENLARVMAKQGKTSKAVDIYKKLIWKFPQKKAYFASQIDSLKGK